MKNKTVEEKLDNIADTIIFVQIVMVIFNVFFGIWAINRYYIASTLLGGMIVRVIIQSIAMFWLVKKEKDSPKNSTAWCIFICCLASGFTNIFSSSSSFFWGNLEILLIICGVILLVRHYAYIRIFGYDSEK